MPYEWNGVAFNASGDASVTLTAANGCDSIVNMTLVVNSASEVDLTETICAGSLPYEWNGVAFNAAGDASVTLTAANGCDSVVNMTLIVNSASEVDLTETICAGSLPYEWNGVAFNASGDASVTLTAANGCDSIVNMTLVVNSASEVDLTETICAGALPYEWNGVAFNASGDASVTLTAANGCDSIVNMTLVVSPIYNVSETRTICQGDLPYTWNNFTFGTGGTQTVTLTSSAGCDSVVTMTLVVNATSHEDIQISACDSYEWNGQNLITSGEYTHTYTSSVGCDSVVTLHLVINHSVNSEFTIETSDSCYNWNGQTYCASGDYIQTLTSANGCDSTVTLHLTITVGIDEHDFSALMTLYPNPTSGIININITNFNTPITKFLIYDVYGKIVDEVRLQHSDYMETLHIDLSRMSNGIYFVKAEADGKVVAVRKVVKQ